ncbi:MAG TPA: SPFH domain-containing protein [Acidimicrobiales bacterium]|nr:SPFH domain-containing protein [Acidimicrobiales bacterium]
MAYVILLAVIALVLFVYVVAGVKIVLPYQKGLVEQLGKYKQTVDPGLRLIVPWFQSMRLVDMREQVIDVPPQEVITSDNVVVAVDAVIYFEPTEPQRLVYNVANFMLAVTKLAQTNLRNVIGDMQLDEALTSRDKINAELREILDDATDKWGVRVGRVEIQRIDPPPDVTHAMHEQMKAERTRRATVTQAEGERQAAVMRAEGDQRAVILRAEGDKQQQILRAEGQATGILRVAEAERFRQEVVAQGEAGAITSVYGAIRSAAPDTALLTIKYLDALRAMADGRATKIVVPTELAGMAGSLAVMTELMSNGDGSGGGGAARPDAVDEAVKPPSTARPDGPPHPPEPSPPPIP